MRLCQLTLLTTVLSLCALPAHAVKIMVDPGHGDTDPGATACGLRECDIVLDVGLKLRDLLDDAGVEVYMTRETDVFIPLTDRTDYANSVGVDRFVSVHANANNDPAAHGTETYAYIHASTNSIAMRDLIHEAMIDAWGLYDRGPKTANFHVLRETTMPATLSELAFVTNCTLDAPVLADADKRTDMAVAHLNALAEHLDFDAPTVEHGQVYGVVYDATDGDNTLVRIGGARIVVEGTDEEQTSHDGTGVFSFQLEPGSYTLKVTAPHFTDVSRACDVVANDVVWCSVAMVSIGASGEGEGEGEGDDGGEGEGPTKPRLVVFVSEQGSCAQAPMPLALVLASLLWARRRKSALAALALVACIALPARAQSATTATAATQVARGGFGAAVLSPDGRHVLVADRTLANWRVVDVDGKKIGKVIITQPFGPRPVWYDNQRFALRAPRSPFAGAPLTLFDLNGNVQGPAFEHATVRAWQERAGAAGDRVVVEHTTVAGKNRSVVSPNDKRCFAPLVSARGDVLFSCLGAGLWLARGDGPSQSLGDGTDPVFSADGATVAFVRVRDDGEDVTDADLIVVDVAGGAARVVYQTRGVQLERLPSLSADGRTMSYVVGDALFVQRLP